MRDAVPLREHLAALRQADATFLAERDRRMTEVAVEREKALKIKETADLAALQLARDIQTYKDEKANELREQINRERNIYATKDDLLNATEKLEALVKPLLEYIAAQQGHSRGLQAGWGFLVGVFVILAGASSVIGYLVHP